ncbi:fumarylacetoacetate hydrolase family protein [Pseudoduganella namucuonensis]|uniref:2-keto-4-pentenoate hydratase/2-oxohepta-3-ene-1,7-dioic acid hydratase (Catechol pathway) n=1 Tax=Pseudoduganella namucuonensis TaxID=1035707 RepID=A0A1I7IHG1_9BURK|nr:fumarylacetoacetate hydrolase family protein [Pseudoduganella namucuonensis]SFU72368.1 2-keto-4-pentenoate hydratase/2-oxohepta-3-ene-1,7-dioic acid hydratase (catechol pathway) [Pseudoduganella namucuonensis]
MLPVLVNISSAGGAPYPALLHGGRALALDHWFDTAADRAGSIAALLHDWTRHAPALEALCRDTVSAEAIARHGVPVEACRVHAPIAPRQVYCTIGNYRAQLLEAALDGGDGPAGPEAPARRAATLAAIETRRREGAPYVCMKGSVCVAGPNDDLEVGEDLATLDWEVEIGVVIGRAAWRVDRASALEHIAGYCVVNDITLRERVFRTDLPALGTDWLRSKARPGWLPAGPWLAPAWNVPDPNALELRLRLNGETMQQGAAGDMLFDIAQQIAYLSQHTRLEPGDLICTGSPAGFGSHHRRYLRPGDIVEASVTGLGTQRMRCVP